MSSLSVLVCISLCFNIIVKMQVSCIILINGLQYIETYLIQSVRYYLINLKGIMSCVWAYILRLTLISHNPEVNKCIINDRFFIQLILIFSNRFHKPDRSGYQFPNEGIRDTHLTQQCHDHTVVFVAFFTGRL